MKQTLFILFSLIASLGHAITVKEATAVTNEVRGGGIFPASTAAVYALNNATPTVLSAVIDLGAYPGAYVSITSSTSQQVDFLWSTTPTAATFRKEYSVNGGGSDFYEKKGRYLRLQVTPPGPTGLTGTTTSIWYVLADTQPVTAVISGGGAAQAVTITSVATGVSITVNNTDASAVPVRITGSTAVSATIAAVATGVSITVNNTDASAVPVRITGTTVISGTITTAGNVSINAGTSIIGAVGVTSTTMPAWTLLSVANYNLTGTVTLNLTATAGSSGTMKYKITALGPGPGFYHNTTPGLSSAIPQGYYAVSTTPVIDDYLASGTVLNLSATAAAVTVTVQVEISKLGQVVP